VGSNTSEEHATSIFRIELDGVRMRSGDMVNVIDINHSEPWVQNRRYVLKMEALRSSEILGPTYQTTRCHNLEIQRLYTHRHDNFKSQIYVFSP
jgi:hypothetical protein